MNPQITITISMLPNGGINVNAPLSDEMGQTLTLGLLMRAIVAVSNHKPSQILTP